MDGEDGTDNFCIPVKRSARMSVRLRTVFRAAVSAVIILILLGVAYRKTQIREPVTATSFKLNTVVKITLYDCADQEILEEAFRLCDTYEKIFSRTQQDSELYRLNYGLLPEENGAYKVSEPLAQLVSKGLSYSKLSGGAFDISIGPLSSLWDFSSGEHVVPAQEEIDQAKMLVGYQNVSVEDQKIDLKKGMSLELGAIAKGYVADRIKEFLVSKGVKSAVIDLGGNVLCIGERTDGNPFHIGIQRPFADRNETVGTVEIRDRSVVSSGIYERYFEKDGKLYHHILDPKSGYPYDNDLLSVTIISEQSADGDALSTVCFALGLKKGMELIERTPDVQAVFITSDGELHFSEGFEAGFKGSQ